MLSRRFREYREVPERYLRWFPVHVLQTVYKLQQMCPAECEFVLVGLIPGPHSIIHVRSRGLLDMTAEDMRHRLVRSESNQTAHALEEARIIRDIQTAGIKRVPCQQNPCAAIVISEVSNLMSGNGKHIYNAISEIDAAGDSGQFLMPNAFCSASGFARTTIAESKPLSPAV